MSADSTNYSGIYRIRNLLNGKFYIGSTVSFRQRKKTHWSQLRSGKSVCTVLQHAWQSYGEKAFIFEPLLICDRENLRAYEQAVLDRFQPFGGNGYNVLVSAEYGAANRGVPKSAEHRAKISAANKGKPKSEASKVLMRKPKSAEHRAKLSEIARGRTSPQKGKPLSGYQKSRLLAANLGSKHSDGHNARISAGLKAAYVSGLRPRLKPGQKVTVTTA
jgi:group I intron endonuclease